MELICHQPKEKVHKESITIFLLGKQFLSFIYKQAFPFFFWGGTRNVIK